MRFSVIIPVYNRKDAVKKAIQSVLSQSFGDFELILIDDGSNDGTEEVLDRYAQEDNRIRVIHKKNGGVSAARNTGIKEAGGDFIVFLDSDDLLSHDALSAIAAHADNTDIICFGFDNPYQHYLPCSAGAYRTIEKQIIQAAYIPPFIVGPHSGEFYVYPFCWNKCYRRDFLTKNNLFFDENKRIWEDGRFVINAFDRAESMTLAGVVLYHEELNSAFSHLSGIWFDNMIDEFLHDQSEWRLRFPHLDYGNEYNRINYDLLHHLFNFAVQRAGEKAKQPILRALNHPLAKEWIAGITPKNEFESAVQQYSANSQDMKIFRAYRPSIPTRAISKVKSMISKG